MLKLKNNYYNKYKKYKKKYTALKNNKFYFVHSPLDFETLISILKDGVIYSGKYISEDKRKLSKQEPTDYVYTNIYFDDIKNLKHPWNFDLILRPELLDSHDIIFNKGWLVNPGISEITSYYVCKDDNTIQKNKQINKIKQYIENELHNDKSGVLTHEVLFHDKIFLENNLLAIVCSNCNDNQLQIIKKIIRGSSVKLIKTNTLPTYDNVI